MPATKTFLGRALAPTNHPATVNRQLVCPYLSSVTDHMTRCCPCSAAVKKALGVDPDRDWEECNMIINAQFYGTPWTTPTLCVLCLSPSGFVTVLYCANGVLSCIGCFADLAVHSNAC